MTDVATYPIPGDEQERLSALRALHVLDTPSEERFDRITRTVQRALDVPIALVSLVDAERQWFKSCIGLPMSETPRGVSFCTHAIMQDRILEIPDAREDPIFAANPLVTGPPHLVFYAGMPLRSPSGYRVGTLCILDHRPRVLTDDDRTTLRDLAEWADLELGITDMSRASKEVERLRARLQLVLASAGEAICAVDDAGQITLMNPAAERLTGWPERELVGLPFTATLMGQQADGTPAVDHVARTLSAGAAQVDLEGVVWDRAARGIPVIWSVAPIVDSGRVSGAVVIAEDASRRFEVERLKDEFVSTVSHELRTPLTSIRGSLGLVAAGVLGELPAEAQQVLEVAARNTERLVRLVNDMLDLERMRSGRVEIVRTDCDVAALVSAAIGNVAALADQGDVALDVRCPALDVYADPDRIVQALTNLLSNAIKFSPAGTAVEVDAEEVEDFVRIAIRDYGRGIPADRIDRIFDRFEQVDASDAREKGGTGLGLAITRHIVDAHGGRIWADSAPGDGATFVVVLPKSPEEAA